MNIRPHPSRTRVRELFDYSEETYEKKGVVFTGGLLWRPRVDSLGRPNTREVGKFAGTLSSKDTRLTVAIYGVDFEVHRLVWIWHNGVIRKLVDHASRDTRDNRIGNLRQASYSGNNANRTPTGGSSKYVGVYFQKTRGRWIAQTKKDGKHVYVGSFATEVEAALARDEATKKLHGAFGVLNFAPA